MNAEEPIPIWNQTLGGLLFVAGLAVWVRLSLDLLPYTYHDLHYLLTLEGGTMGPVEWVHPLFVPLMGAYRRLLGLYGFSGRMLLPLESANLAVAALTLAALFLLAARLSRDAVAAAAGALWLGFSQGFWSGALRPDPYSLAAASTVATLGLLLLQKTGREKRLYLLAGAAAGLTTSLHASGLSLVPVAAAAAWSQAGLTRRAARLLGVFLAALAAVTVSAYLILLAYHHIGMDYFKHTGLLQTFRNIEQMPQSSIYTSGHWSKQASDLLRTLHHHAGTGLLPLLATLAGVTVSRPGSRGSAAAICLASTASYTAFFLINNTQNGFMFAALLSMPLLLCVLPGIPKMWRPLAAPALLAAMSMNLPYDVPTDGPTGDPLFTEARFLRTLIGKGDLLVLPGSPFPELMYERRFDALQAGDAAQPAHMSIAPVAQPEEFKERLTDRLLLGKRVFFSAGSPDTAAATGDNGNGSQKRRQPFSTWGVDAAREAASTRVLTKSLRSSFDMDCGLRSPQGWAYCRLRLKRGARKTRVARAGVARPGQWAILEDRDRRDFLGLKIRYLLDWLAESPKDPFVLGDLDRLSNEDTFPDSPDASPSPDALAAIALVEKGIAHFRAGKREQAELSFREAIRSDKNSISAWMSLGAMLDASGKRNEALSCYDRILNLTPSQDVLADTLAARANVLAALGRGELARRDRQQALLKASPSWPWRKEIGEALR